MSLQQYFSETQAVVQGLSEYVEEISDKKTPETEAIGPNEEQFTAIWQAAELLSRAYSVLLPMVQFEQVKAQFEQSKAALNLPDVQKEKPKQPKKAHLYGADGKPLS